MVADNAKTTPNDRINALYTHSCTGFVVIFYYIIIIYASGDGTDGTENRLRLSEQRGWRVRCEGGDGMIFLSLQYTRTYKRTYTYVYVCVYVFIVNINFRYFQVGVMGFRCVVAGDIKPSPSPPPPAGRCLR